jgi:hypothetical protein
MQVPVVGPREGSTVARRRLGLASKSLFLLDYMVAVGYHFRTAISMAESIDGRI